MNIRGFSILLSMAAFAGAESPEPPKSPKAALHTWDRPAGASVENLAATADGFVVEVRHDKGRDFLDPATGKKLASFPDEKSTADALSRDGSTSALALPDGTIGLRSTSSGKDLSKLESCGENLTTIAFSTDGKRLAGVAKSGKIVLWNTADGKKLREFAGPAEEPMAFALDAEGKSAATGHGPGAILTWDLERGCAGKKLSNQGGFITYVEFAPGGKSLLTFSADGKVALREVESDKQLMELSSSKSKVSIMFMRLSPDGSRLAAGTLHEEIAVLSVPAGQIEWKVDVKGKGVVQHLAWSSDGKKLATCDDNHDQKQSVVIWEVPASK